MKTTLFKAAEAASLVIIEGVEMLYGDIRTNDTVTFEGVDGEDWILKNQELEIDSEGKSVAQDQHGSVNMEFRVTHPLTEDDLKEGNRDPAGKRLIEGYKALRGVLDKGQMGQHNFTLDKVQIKGILGLLSGEFEGVY
ncbi:hypothetical protein DLP3_131 [Stenotrophomonas phage vB_SmaS_DLP_3]|nr:hypothetical protein DLP3_131 [Stenotrophomonas phage vB_SmaS_DLP_3]